MNSASVFLFQYAVVGVLNEPYSQPINPAQRSSRTGPPSLHNIGWNHRLKMEVVYLGSMSRDVHSCTPWLRPRNPFPPSPRIGTRIRGRYWSAKIDDISLEPHGWNRVRPM
jgi:hypothetical protein